MVALLPLQVFGLQAVDRFDSYETGELAVVSNGSWQFWGPATQSPKIVVHPGSHRKHVRFGVTTRNASTPAMARALLEHQQIPSDGSSTFYFRVQPHGTRIYHSIGLAANLSNTPDYGDFRTQVSFLDAVSDSSTHFRVQVRSGADTWEVLSSAPKGQWYEFWIVVDRDRGTYQVWYSPDGTHPVMLAKPRFRSPTSLPLTTILAMCTSDRTVPQSVDFDDFYVRPGRIDLQPPEATSVQPAFLRVNTFNTHNGTGASLATFRDVFMNGDHVICLQEIPPANWAAIQEQFPHHPYRLYTEKRATRIFSFKRESIAILSAVPILESDAKIIQIDPQGDLWERWAQYVKLDLGNGKSIRLFHYHNTYNFNENDFEWEKAGMQKLRDWILEKTDTVSLADIPDLVVLGDFNLTNPGDVTAILPIPMIRMNWRDYIMSNLPARASTTLWTQGSISDHNGLAASLDIPVATDSYERWAFSAFTLKELDAGLGAPDAQTGSAPTGNFASYAFDLHPWRNAPPPVASEPMAFAFNRALRTDVRYELQASSSVTNWTTFATAEAGGFMTVSEGHQVTETTSANGSVITRITVPKNPNRRFYRLKALADPH